MKKKFQSFSKRLSRRIIIFVLLLVSLIGAFIVYVYITATQILLEGHYKVEMDASRAMVEEELRTVEKTASVDIRNLLGNLDSPEHVFKALEDNMQYMPKNTGIIGYFAAFEPDYYPQQGRWFEPYAVVHDTTIVREQVGSAQHDYLSSEWYQKGLASDSGYWSHPYLYQPIDGPASTLCTYVLPIRDKSGRRVGVFGADMALNWFTMQLDKEEDNLRESTWSEIEEEDRENLRRKDKQQSDGFLICRDGTFIAHPDTARILKDNFYRQFEASTDIETQRMVSEMKAGKFGTAQTRVDGRRVIIFYSPVEHTDWIMGIIVSQMDMWVLGIVMAVLIAIVMIIGLIALYIVCTMIIRHTTQPLHALSDAVNEVAKGRFDVPLPKVPHNDEIRLLRDTFEDMQKSLGEYVEQLKVTTAEKTAFETEMNTARTIQKAMIPDMPDHPQDDGYDIYGMMMPAKSVGGDLYDFFLRDGSLFFCLGDVAGKGVPAALVMAVTRSLFRSVAAKEEDPQHIMTRINRFIYDDNKDTGMFVTLFIGVLDLQTGRLDYCCGGHEPPLVFADGVDRLPVIHRLPVGALDETVYKKQTTMLAPQTTLLLFTDGLTEAFNDAKDMFEVSRVMETGRQIQADGQTQPRQVVDRMMAAVKAFVGNADQSDDLTMLAIQFQPQKA